MADAVEAVTASMQADMLRLSVIANNAANATTVGFKRQLAVMRSVTPLVPEGAQSLSMAGSVGGIPRVETLVDHRLGTLTQTGNPLDVAVDGEGFFEVATDAGPAYTRRGVFRIDSGGRLVTEQGNQVAGASGEIVLMGANPTIDRQGNVVESGKTTGQLKVVRFARNTPFESLPGGLLLTDAEPLAVPPGGARIRQGMVENSNVNSTTEMVKLLEATRHFEAGQRVMQGYGDMYDRVLRSLGEF